MAERPVFVPFTEGIRLVREIAVRFRWHPGMAPSQKRKNVVALHEAARVQGLSPLLEISSKSEIPIGVNLSAFNLQVALNDGSSTTLECAFQGSKVFENGGPFHDIYRIGSRAAKRDERLQSRGRIRGFQLEGQAFPSEPKTAFYDWLYAKALATNHGYLAELQGFHGFTDIEFNPERSVNCQARSCAIFVSLCRKGLLNQAIESPASFIRIVSGDSAHQPYAARSRQGELFD